MIVKQLREALAKLPESDDGREVVIWLPGSRIDLATTVMSIAGKELLIEGNLRPGSALED